MRWKLGRLQQPARRELLHQQLVLGAKLAVLLFRLLPPRGAARLPRAPVVDPRPKAGAQPLVEQSRSGASPELRLAQHIGPRAPRAQLLRLRQDAQAQLARPVQPLSVKIRQHASAIFLVPG